MAASPRRCGKITSVANAIAIDATYSLGGNLSGVGVYSREILAGLTAGHADQRFLFTYRSHRLGRSFREVLPANASRALLRTGGIFPWRCRAFHALNQRVDRRFAPTVATFHDLFVMTGEYSSPDFRRRFSEQARKAAANSDLLIAVSEFTAGQIVDLLGVERSRIRVIHHGPHMPPEAPPPDSERENVVLHVGTIQARKNIGRLVEAFEAMQPGWRLVLAGAADGFGAAGILARIEQSPRRADISVTGYLPGSALEVLYRKARIFAFPSLDEGFGMPVLDAMARGVPVLVSNRGALPEVVGAAALVVDALDARAIAAGLNGLAAGGEVRRMYRERGLVRAQAFSWHAAARATWAVYRELGV